MYPLLQIHPLSPCEGPSHTKAWGNKERRAMKENREREREREREKERKRD